MTAGLDIPAAQRALVTRLDPPSSTLTGKPLLVGAGSEGWTRGRLALFCGVFVLPSALAVLYYAVFAADIYVSDSQFIVRSQGARGPGVIESFGDGPGLSVGATDVNSVIAYIQSRDALEAVSRRLDLRQAYGPPFGDFLARFPGFTGGNTSEDLFAYYRRHVEAIHDKSTGVTTLTVSAFDAGAARKIATVLLEEAERLVNDLSRRMQEDTLARAVRNVADASRQLEAAQQALQDWRSRERQYDPALFTKSVIAVVTSLSVAIAEAKAKRAELAKISPRNPELAILDNKIVSLQQQIRSEWLTLAGESESLAPQISAYERLVIDRDLAVKLYAAANESLERTRSDVRRQSVFVERISEPPAPDKPLYPWRILNSLLAVAFAFMTFLIVDQLAANIRRHRRLADYVKLKSLPHG